jgi:predicted RNase H-like HicB family nuclease
MARSCPAEHGKAMIEPRNTRNTKKDERHTARRRSVQQHGAMGYKCTHNAIFGWRNRGMMVRNTGASAMNKQLTAIIEREGSGYVSLCPELDIASQGDTIEDARNNLREALELFFETASQAEIRARLHEEIYVTRVEVTIG